MTYISMLTPGEAQTISKLRKSKIKELCKAPDICGHPDPTDPEFGCPFLWKYVCQGKDILIKCSECTLRK